MQLQIKYGPDQINKTFDAGTTVGDIKDNDSVRAALGFGDNINVLINGVAQNDDTVLQDGQSLTIETAANQKA